MLIYVWCKSTEPTAGRVIGNAALVVASGAVAGYQAAMYGTTTTYFYPDAYVLDNSTIWMAYVIDPENGMVIHIEQRVLPYDLTSIKNRDRFVSMLAGLPELMNNNEENPVSANQNNH